MNRTKIEWTDYTWNPITGCNHGCEYCYARKIAERFPKAFPKGFEPAFHEDRLSEPRGLRKPAKIFTVSMGDMFGEWVPVRWIAPIFMVMNDCPQHTFQILTKNPKRINEIISGDLYTQNIWLGTSVENDNGLSRIDEIRKVPRFKKFVSFEPLLEDINPDLADIDWVIIGPQTNPDKLPEWDWVETIIEEADYQEIPIFVKNNIISHCTEIGMGYQNYPEEMCL